MLYMHEIVCSSLSLSLSLPPPSLSLFLQLSGWWFLTFTASEIKDKVHYLNGVQYLYDTINPDQIEMPQFVFDFDRQVSIYPMVYMLARHGFNIPQTLFAFCNIL